MLIPVAISASQRLLPSGHQDISSYSDEKPWDNLANRVFNASRLGLVVSLKSDECETWLMTVPDHSSGGGNVLSKKL